jgi:hypothetical protein
MFEKFESEAESTKEIGAEGFKRILYDYLPRLRTNVTPSDLKMLNEMRREEIEQHKKGVEARTNAALAKAQQVQSQQTNVQTSQGAMQGSAMYSGQYHQPYQNVMTTVRQSLFRFHSSSNCYFPVALLSIWSSTTRKLWPKLLHDTSSRGPRSEL